MSELGHRRPRREDARLVRGQGAYLADLHEPGLLYCAFVRNMAPHGRLEAVSVAGARSAPGVVAAYAADDLRLPDIPGASTHGPEASAMGRPPLAHERVRYVGEPVAVVVAESRYAAADAAELVLVDVAPEPPVADVERALADDVLLFPEAGTNVVSRSVVPENTSGSPEYRWPVSAEIEVENQRLAPVPIEPLGMKASPDGRGGLVVWCGHQAPHRLRRQLATFLGLDEARIRVVIPDVGGAFGMKGMLYPEYVVTAAAAVRLGRPVMWNETRYEEFLGGTHGRGQRHRVRLAGEADGRIRSAQVEIVADMGAYPHNGSMIPWFTRYMATGPYDISDVRIAVTMVVTNRAPTGSYRGAGRPEAAYAMERAVEAYARAAGLDPAEVRRTNFIRPEAMPYRTATGALYDSGDYAGALDLALELADAAAVRTEQRRRRDAGLDPIGLGIGAFVERAGGSKDSWEYARVELDGQGRLHVRVGTSASGQGHETTWSQVLADVFDVEPDEVGVVAGDTAAVREGTGSFASRSAQIAGSAIQRTGLTVRELARGVAAELLEASPHDLKLSDGHFAVRGDPTVGVGLREVAEAAAERGVELAAEERYSPHAQTFPYGVHVAVVAVDLDTGMVDVEKMVAVDDCGNVINSLIVEGQVHGSVLQGVAQALYEGITYTEEGQPLTSSLVDYLTPTAPDAPTFTTGRLVTPAPSNPLGVKGAGESGCIGAPPAVVNAVLDALEPYGVTDLQMPLTPQRVWRALQEARTRSSGRPAPASGGPQGEGR